MLEGSIFRSANFVYTEHIHLLCLPTNEIIYETLSTAQFSAIQQLNLPAENCLLRVVVRKQFLRSVAYAPELEGLLRLVKPASYIIHGWIQLMVMPRSKTKVCPIIQLKVELSTIRSSYCFVCSQNFENPSVAFWAKACNLKKAVQLRLLLILLC